MRRRCPDDVARLLEARPASLEVQVAGGRGEVEKLPRLFFVAVA
ncbi:hypothetical protein ACF06V_23300 [Streptomyces bobili]